MPVKTMDPRDLEILDKDMKAVATTEYPSVVMDASKDYAWTAVVEVDNTGGGATGIAKLTLRRFRKMSAAGAGVDQIGDDLDILTAINTKVDGNFEVVWGYGVSALERGAGTIDIDADSFQLAGVLQVVLEVTEISDATTCIASVTLIRRHE